VRNIKLFLRDKATVFFSVLSPFIILFLYLAFLRTLQVDGVKAISVNFPVDEKLILSLMDSWLISSLLAVSCLTVALNSLLVMVTDKSEGKFKDFLVSPVKSRLITLSYFLSSLMITLLIVFLVFIVSIIYLVATNEFYLSVTAVIQCLGMILISCISAVLMLMLIVGLFKSHPAVGAFGGVFSSLIGFVIGAYMPPSTFAVGIQYVINIFPGAHSAAIFRNVLMAGALNSLAEVVPAATIEILKSAYSFDLKFFGADVGALIMFIYLTGSAVIFLAVNLITERIKKRKMYT
jgi:multidrug/hemolysin transport system permease protein